MHRDQGYQPPHEGAAEPADHAVGGNAQKAGGEKPEYQVLRIEEDCRSHLDAVNQEHADEDGGDGASGNAQCQDGDHGGSGDGVVGAFRGGDTLDHARAPFVPVLGAPFLLTIGNEARNRRTQPRQDTDTRAQARGTADNGQTASDLGPGQALVLLVDGSRRDLGRGALADVFRLQQNFRHHEGADQQRHQMEPAQQVDVPEIETLSTGDYVESHHGQPDADERRHQPLDDRAPHHRSDDDERHGVNGEILRRSQLDGPAGDPHGAEDQQQFTDRIPTYRSQGCHLQCLAGLALLGHGMAVQLGGGGGGRARRVEQDCRDGTAEAPRLADNVKEHQRREGVQVGGCRHDHGDGSRRGQAGRGADNHPKQGAQEDEAEGHGIGKQCNKSTKEVHGQSPPAKNVETSRISPGGSNIPRSWKNST